MVKVIFPYTKELLFKRSSHFEKGRNCRESLLDTVVSLRCAYFFQRSGYAIGRCEEQTASKDWQA